MRLIYFLSFVRICTAIWYRYPVNPIRHSFHSGVSSHRKMLKTVHLLPSACLHVVEDQTNLNFNALVGDVDYDQIVDNLIDKYNGKFVRCNNNHFPHCDVLLCGTLHISNASTHMVRDIVQCMRPETIVIELCQGRLDTLVDYARSLRVPSYVEKKITLSDVFKNALTHRSFKGLAMDLLAWMQYQAARLVGNPLGGEFGVAALEAHRIGANVVLGDRMYEVTTQRIYDQLSWLEKLNLFRLLVWEILTMGLFNVSEYIRQTERDATFVRDEIETFTKWMPKLGRIVIGERDLYMGKTICDVAAQMSLSHTRNDVFGGDGGGHDEASVDSSANGGGIESATLQERLSRRKRRRLLAVVGAGHLEGLQRIIGEGDVNAELVRAVSVSSLHPTSTWPGSGSVQIVETHKIFGDIDPK